ncbi:MAG TPA: lipopolysaccharide biosynthesis protein [Roseiflexaceae bacterium]|nr:lipopolysaccharide biosynthesis protein [Roseiflexaceae bacterium]
MITWGEVLAILRTVLRWWWVIVVAVALAAGSAFYISRETEERFYIAKATLMVGNTFESVRPDESEMSLATALTRYYNEMIRREPILRPVQEKLQLPFPWELVRDRMLYASIVANANLLDVQITDTDPERAARIANGIGEQLIAASPASPEKVREQQQAIQTQISDSNAKIEQLRKQIDELSAERLEVTSASDATELNDRLEQLNASLESEQKVYLSLLDVQTGSTVNTLRFVERAVTPTSPLPSRRMVAVGAGALGGLVLALVAIFLLDALDTRWRGARDVHERFRLRHLGTLPAGAPLLQASGDFATQRAQAVRAAHLNLLLALGEGGRHTLLISSTRAHEQRAAFALDLACLFARSGHQVLLVGVDGASALLGRTLLVPGQASLLPRPNGHFDARTATLATAVPNLCLLPLWPEGPDSPAPVPTLRLPECVPQLAALADVVIFDGPAALEDAGAALLAPETDGAVLVLAPEDRRGEVTQCRDRLLNQPAARILGAVVLAAPRKRGWLPGRKQSAPLTGTPAPAIPAMAAAETTETPAETPEAAQELPRLSVHAAEPETESIAPDPMERTA